MWLSGLAKKDAQRWAPAPRPEAESFRSSEKIKGQQIDDAKFALEGLHKDKEVIAEKAWCRRGELIELIPFSRVTEEI